MFSSRRRALGRRAQVRLVLLGIVCITSLLAITRSPDFIPVWQQPVRQAFAQADTATPTVLPQADPTVGLSEPPLTLQSSASVANAVAGEQLSFTTTIATASAEPRAVELRASIDGQLEFLSASGGSCSGGAVLSCKLSVQRGQPVTIVAAVRVRPSAAAGSRLVYQALAQDDLSNTAASDQVSVTIAPAPTVPPTPPDPAPRPTVAPNIPANDASAPARPNVSSSRPVHHAPTALPASVANPLTPSLPAPTTPALPVVPVAILRSSAGAATIAMPVDSAADSWLVSAPGIHAPAQALDPGAPVLVVPEQPDQPEQETLADSAAAAPMDVEQRQIVLLPNTAAAPLNVGFVAVLLSLALTIHGLRRVRRAAVQLERQGAALGRLATLAGAESRRRAKIGSQSSETRS